MLISRGIIFSPDSGAYDTGSDALIALGFDYFTWAQGDLGLHYAGFVSVLALLKLSFGEGWVLALVGLNLLALSATAYAVCRTLVNLSLPPWIIAMSMVAVAGLYDVMQWAAYALSDPVFIACVTSATLMVGSTTRWTVSNMILVGMIACLGVIWRPTGVIFFGFLLVLPLVLGPLSSPSVGRRRAALGAMVMLSGLAFAAFAAVMQDISLLPASTREFMSSMVKQYYDAGEVVYDRPATYHTPPDEYLDYLWLVFDRWFHFFWITAEGHSTAHTAYGLLVRGPVMLLAALAVLRLVASSPLNALDARLIATIIILLWVFSSAHGMLQVDYDWRYRAPVMPSLVCLALLTIGRMRRPVL